MKVGDKREDLRINLEQEGNIGLDYCINPVIYPIISNFLFKNNNSKVIDFGAGTNILGLQFLYGYEKYTPALKQCKNLYQSRENINHFIGLETTTNMVNEFNKYKTDMGISNKITIQQFDIISGNTLPFSNNSINLCISRNFLMHLSEEDFSYHIQEVYRILKKGGKYIFAILNPKYEEKKYNSLNNGLKLKEGQKYNFSHGKTGEYGIFYHYFKSKNLYNKIISRKFNKNKIINCIPITDEFKNSHKRYYDINCPMALIYELEK